ncbi:MAG: transglutaminaseTgpA domain-containing protein, partial [Planctomycetota bacterium]
MLFGAHLLVYLTWIVSLQQKTFKVCWSLVALSVLQVAVASVLTAGAAFGLGLAFFLALTLWALTNLSARWPEADRKRSAGAGPGRSSSVGAVVRAGRVGRSGSAGTKRTTLAVAAVTVALGLSLFLMTPRTWLSRRPPIDPTRTAGISAAYTGFTGKVRLGALGEILESAEPAFEVQVESPSTGRSLELGDVGFVFGTEEPLFRGRTLDRYEEGAWSDSSTGAEDWRALPTDPPPSGAILTIERYRLWPIGDEALFHSGAAAVVRFEKRSSARAARRSVDGLLLRPKNVPAGEEIEYVVYSVDLRRVLARDRSRYAVRAPAPRGSRLAAYLQQPPGLTAVEEAAAEAVASLPNEGAGDGDRAIAERLVGYLRDSGRYGYSLDLSVVDPTIDAVEDFLANKRTGHCEYFATALALMLRARGIPSRIVTGF